MLKRGLHISACLMLIFFVGLPCGYSQIEDDLSEGIFPESSEPLVDAEEMPEPNDAYDEPAEEIAPSPIESPARLNRSILQPSLPNQDGEKIQERYPDGRIMVERGVTQDEQENYVNHGLYTKYNESGDVIAQGNYEFGERQGDWKRVYEREESDLFSKAPFNQYVGPYTSTAHFEAGKLHGEWIIRDSSDRIICRWPFANGRRHGESVWYHNNKTKMRVLNYVNGELNGEFLEHDQNGEATVDTKYMDGRRLEKITENFQDGQPKQRGYVLRPRLALKSPDDWWSIRLAKYTVHGKSEKHGKWTTWHPNGQEKVIGEYQFDERSGEFVWYHDNGQKWIQAFYTDGKKDGLWTWWHKNGQKSISGTYVNDSPAGRWIWWHESGKVAQRVNYSEAQPQSARHATTAEKRKQSSSPR